MKYKLAAALLLIVALSGCIGEGTTDTYRCSVDDGVLYLSSNGEYELLFDEGDGIDGIYGEYTEKEGRILLKRSFIGDIVIFTIDERDLIDPGMDRWVRD